MKEEVTHNEFRLWLDLHKFYDLISKVWKNNVSIKDDISSKQFKVLRAMNYLSDSSDKPIIISDLIPHLNRSINSISSIVDRMEKNGLIEKIRDLPDKRAIRLRISPKGDEILKNNEIHHRQHIKKLFFSVSKKEQEILISILDRLKKNTIEILTNSDPDLNNYDQINHLLSKLNSSDFEEDEKHRKKK